jgi:hypothetical protein
MITIILFMSIARNNHFEDKLFLDKTCSTDRGALLAVMNVEIRNG